MIDDKGFTINKTTYDWAVRLFQYVERYLGINIKVHGNENNTLGKGQIFLFNHFARFETLIPPYLIHTRTGAYCRSVADHGLFEASDGLANILSDLGALPNNMPGLLPFLAAEILRGNKVIIFPEGGMIKNRRVVDELGDYGIFSPTSLTFRKHHRGAAVLAFTLELFKRRIKWLFKTGDERRIRHWYESLGLSGPEQLLEEANRPTLIVPGNITFYPIRADENIIHKGMELLMRDKKLPLQAIEEIAVEGNILLKNTDMDIRLGTPITPQKKWHWWENLLLSRFFLNIHSLDDFFSLREAAHSWSERLLVQAISKETNRIRDAYMAGIYEGVSIHLSHLASVLIDCLLDEGRTEVPSETFHRALYLGMKTLQTKEGVHLHRSLSWPDRYRGLADGQCEGLEQFLETCTKAQLIQKTATGYQLLDKLREEHEYHVVRMENPVEVYANEAAPIREVAPAMADALARAEKISEPELATLLFDDELRLHAWNRAHFSRKRYEEINKRETASKTGQPYLMVPKKGAKVGVLLAHGFLASPDELRDFGNMLYRKGYAVLGVRLSGHATSPWDLHERKWEEWLASVQRGYRILSAFCDQVVMVGFSTGGGLSLMHAANQPDKLAGVAAVCAPLSVQDRNIVFTPLVHSVNRLVGLFSSGGGIVPFRESGTNHPDINYQSMPVGALSELHAMMKVLKKKLPEVRHTILLLQATKDPVVQPKSAKHILDRLGSKNKELEWVESEHHGLIYDDIGNTRARLLEFIKSVTAPGAAIDENTEDPGL